MASVDSLPTELLHQICTFLPTPDLLSFGASSRLHHALSLMTLHTLRLGIFPSRIHGLASSLSCPIPETASSAEPINIVLPKGQSRSKDCVIRNQNRKAARILSLHGRSLRDLELAIWSLEKPATDQIAKLARLRHLSIRLDHPHTRHRDLRPNHWREAERSTVWNSFFGDPKERPATDSLPAEPTSQGRSSNQIQSRPVFGELRTVTLERAGITDWQLQRLLEENPGVEELYLRKCTILTEDFFAWLAGSSFSQRLRVLRFECCDTETIDARIVPYLEALVGLEDLSLSSCPRIPNSEIQELARESWPKLKYFALPQLEHAENSTSIEVDPAYK
ncbi:MAG: hypothetical protein MMC23_005769 [Stictis urceolatum]|nr:hypothetical protein [Stictis urceolata]